MPVYNKFTNLPYIPYRIIEYLALNNENIWKILKYNDYDCLKKDNLTFQEKMELIWKNQTSHEKYNIFLTNVVADMLPESKTIVKLYRAETSPDNHLISRVAYEFDFLYGSKIALIDYEGYVTNRGDVLDMELMNTLNGVDVGGVGMLQFNRVANGLCKSRANFGNSSTFTGLSTIMTVQVSSLDLDGGCNGL